MHAQLRPHAVTWSESPTPGSRGKPHQGFGIRGCCCWTRLLIQQARTRTATPPPGSRKCLLAVAYTGGSAGAKSDRRASDQRERCSPSAPQGGPDEAIGDGARRPSPMPKSRSRKKKTRKHVLASWPEHCASVEPEVAPAQNR